MSTAQAGRALAVFLCADILAQDRGKTTDRMCTRVATKNTARKVPCRGNGNVIRRWRMVSDHGRTYAATFIPAARGAAV